MAEVIIGTVVTEYCCSCMSVNMSSMTYTMLPCSTRVEESWMRITEALILTNKGTKSEIMHYSQEVIGVGFVCRLGQSGAKEE